jgi:methylmalonyl-CoA mutase N-terminal domain/subunit
LAAVLGGTQSLHVSGYDEAYDIPSEEAMRISLATQLILSHESGVASTADPLGGAMFLESLTNSMEEKAWEYVDKVDNLGGGSMVHGMLQAIETGYIEQEIARASYEYQMRVESNQQVVVGLNQYQSQVKQDLELFQFDPEEEEWQKERLAQAKSSRSNNDVRNALHAVIDAAQKEQNLMPLMIDAVDTCATEGEIMGALRDVYGEYVDPGVF